MTLMAQFRVRGPAEVESSQIAMPSESMKIALDFLG